VVDDDDTDDDDAPTVPVRLARATRVDHQNMTTTPVTLDKKNHGTSGLSRLVYSALTAGTAAAADTVYSAGLASVVNAYTTGVR
jgi:hypothetical protein